MKSTATVIGTGIRSEISYYVQYQHVILYLRRHDAPTAIVGSPTYGKYDRITQTILINTACLIRGNSDVMWGRKGGETMIGLIKAHSMDAIVLKQKNGVRLRLYTWRSHRGNQISHRKRTMTTMYAEKEDSE